MARLMYNEYDIKFYNEVLVNIQTKLNAWPVTDDEVWECARKSEEIPSFESIFLEMTFARVEEKLKEKYPDIPFDAYINAAASSLSIDHQEVYSLIGFEQIIKEYEGKQDPLFSPNPGMCEEEVTTLPETGVKR